MNPEAVATSTLTAIALVTAGMVSLWRAFLSGSIVSGKTHDVVVTALKEEQLLNRDLVTELRRKNDIDEKVISDRESHRNKRERKSG